MATELDKLVVKIEADLKGLKKGMAEANKVVGNSSKKMSGGLKNLSNSLARVTATASKVGAVLGVAFGAIFVKGVIDTGIQIENLQIRLKALFGTAEEGERAFEKMLEFAGKVPFTLGEIQQASGNLAVVAEDADELAEVLKITGNVAAVTGLDFRQTAEQIQRSFSGGIASADVFRERGVRDLLGFSAGATVSAEQTREAFERVFGKGGTFGNITDELANTLTGTLSMIKDKFMQFQIAVSESFFDELKLQFGDLNVFLDANQEKIKEIGKTIGESLAKFTRFLVDNIDGIKNFFIALAGVATINMVARLVGSIGALTAVMLTNPLFMILSGLALGGIAISQLIKEVRDYIGVNDELTASIAAQNKENKDAIQKQKQFFVEKKKVLDQIKEEQNNKFKPESVSVSKEFEEEINKQAELRKQIFELDNKNLDDLVSIFENAGKAISDTFGKAIASGQSFRQAMLDIFQSVVAQVISLIVQLTVIEPILQRVKSAITGSGFNIFSLLGGGQSFAGEPTGSMVYGGGRAGGGSVNPNMPYMVGERGAEMFVPKSAGTIVPNNQVGGAGGGGNIVIEQNLNFATGVSQTVRAEVMNLLPAIQQSTLSAVQDARLRGGTFAKDFGA